MNSVTGVTRLMFRTGQRVGLKWKVAMRWGFDPKTLYEITWVREVSCGLLFEGKSVPFLKVELRNPNPICIVCGQDIEIKDNKVKEHKHNEELCYGSYTPYG